MNEHPRRGIPLRADRSAIADATITAFVRACIATARHQFDKTTRPVEYARRTWGDSGEAVQYLLRAAATPAQISAPSWAQELAHVVTIFLPSLVQVSAGSALLARGLQLSFDDGLAAIKLPLITFGAAAFVGEAKPIPVVGFSTSAGPTLTPFKLATISVLTREMMDSSNAEAIVRQTLSESVAAGLDAALFSASAGTTDHPPGLLNGVTALPVSTATLKSDAMVDDLAAIIGKVVRIAGAGEVVLVSAPEQATSIKLRYLKPLDYPLLASAALPAGSVIAVAANALASAFGGLPTIEANSEAEIQFDDAPVAISTSGGVIATPIGSLFQTDRVALKIRMQANWVLRAPGAIAYVQGATW
jgi:Phage capsid family